MPLLPKTGWPHAVTQDRPHQSWALASLQVSVHLVTIQEMGLSPASRAHVAPISLKQDGPCASPVAEASLPSTRGQSPSRTVTPKVSRLLTPQALPVLSRLPQISKPLHRPVHYPTVCIPNRRPSCLTAYMVLFSEPPFGPDLGIQSDSPSSRPVPVQSTLQIG